MTKEECADIELLALREPHPHEKMLLKPYREGILKLIVEIRERENDAKSDAEMIRTLETELEEIKKTPPDSPPPDPSDVTQ